MNTKASYDPRINRIELPQNDGKFEEAPLEQWQTFEVFQQQNRGEQHVHVGAVHAPNAEMALVLAKEQFGRREQCASLWVVKSADILGTSYEDADMFQHAFDKSYREGHGYKVKETIETFKKELNRLLDQDQSLPKPAAQAAAQVSETATGRVVQLPQVEGKGPRKVIIRK